MAHHTAESAGLLLRDLFLGTMTMAEIDWRALLSETFYVAFSELQTYVEIYRAQLGDDVEVVSFTSTETSASLTLSGTSAQILVGVTMTEGAIGWIYLNRLTETPTAWADLLADEVVTETLAIDAGVATTTAARMTEIRSTAEYAAVALAASRDGETVYAGSIGRAWLGATSAPTSETPFRAGSVTKPVTALTVLRLAHQGLVDLEAPLSRHLKGVALTAHDGVEPTVRQMLAHTGGLPRNGQGDSTTLRSLRDILDAGVTFIRPPGELYEYSNLGFGLLGLMIEDVTGLSYAAAVHREVFAPEAMTASSMLGDIPASPPAAAGYDVNGGLVLPTLEYFMADVSSGGLVTSTADLLRLGAAVLAEPEMWAAMPAGTAAVYACGLRLQGSPEHPFAFHNGMVPGARASFIVLPRDNVVVVALANGGNDGLDALTTQTASLLVG